MADFDVCELVNLLAQEARMQRLLQMLRNSQDQTCIDNADCLTDESLPLPDSASGTSVFTVAIVCFLVAVLALLAHSRPANRSESRKGSSDRSNDDDNGNSLIF